MSSSADDRVRALETENAELEARLSKHNEVLSAMATETARLRAEVAELRAQLDEPVDPRTVWDVTADQKAVCACGHVYYHHFDPYDSMAAVGCKYCACHLFEEF